MTHHTHGEGKFVERFEEAVMQFVVLNKAAQQGSITQENVQQTFKGNLQMKYSHIDTCLDTLVRENHLTKDGNTYKITDDGREDVQEVQRLAMELANVAGQNRSQGSTTTTPTGASGAGQPKGGPGASSR